VRRKTQWRGLVAQCVASISQTSERGQTEKKEEKDYAFSSRKGSSLID
jgi:hypothetical protein